MMLRPFVRKLFISASLVSLTACTLGPDFNGPNSVEMPTKWTKQDTQSAESSAQLWWKQFNDPTLNSLIDTALDQNLNLEAAGIRILQARMVLGINDALRFPQVQTLSGNLAKIYQNEHSFNSSEFSFDAGWELDVWGKYARGIESAEASYFATIASYRNVAVSITAEVARNYLNYRTFQERMLLSQRNIKIQKRVLQITEAQFGAGDVTELDVQQAKSQLYATQAAYSALQVGLMQSKNALAVLLGNLPEQMTSLLDTPEVQQKMAQFDSATQNSTTHGGVTEDSLIPKPPQLADKVDASLVLRRPDLQISELQAHAQSAKIGAAKAELYPSFSLFGSIGISSTVPSGDSFSFDDSLVVAAGPTFSWNILQYGRLKNNVRLQDAMLQEALVNYNQSVLSAVQEVSSAMSSYQLYQEQEQLRMNSVNASVRAFNISMIQYQNGSITFERLLNSVTRMTQSEDAYAQAKGNVATQVVALYKALGGGWEATTGKQFVSDENIQQMKDRTNWGDYLDTPDLPDEKSSAPEVLRSEYQDGEKLQSEQSISNKQSIQNEQSIKNEEAK
ncbi:MAG: TolC family protein [Vibrio sp.]